MKLKLIDKKKEAGDVTTFIFQPESPISWVPGQFMIYSLPHPHEDVRGIQRFFTISRAPHEKFISISTRIFPKPSSFKKTLNNLKIGDVILAKGPDGDFIIDKPGKKNIFIAGGIGVTPFRSIILEFAKKNEPLNFTLLYSNKDDKFPFEEELDNAMKKFPYSQILKKIGRINRNDLYKFNKNSIFYVTGPDAMVDEVSEILESLGVKKENLRQDYFSGYDT